MKTRNLVLIAIATVFCSCNNSEKAKQKVISKYSQELVEFSKISSIVSGVSNVGRPSINVDSLAKTINKKDSYERNLLKINDPVLEHEVILTFKHILGNVAHVIIK